MRIQVDINMFWKPPLKNKRLRSEMRGLGIYLSGLGAAWRAYGPEFDSQHKKQTNKKTWDRSFSQRLSVIGCVTMGKWVPWFSHLQSGNPVTTPTGCDSYISAFAKQRIALHKINPINKRQPLLLGLQLPHAWIFKATKSVLCFSFAPVSLCLLP